MKKTASFEAGVGEGMVKAGDWRTATNATRAVAKRSPAARAKFLAANQGRWDAILKDWTKQPVGRLVGEAGGRQMQYTGAVRDLAREHPAFKNLPGVEKMRKRFAKKHLPKSLQAEKA